MTTPGEVGTQHEDLTTMLNRLPGSGGDGGTGFSPESVPIEQLYPIIHEVVRRVRRPRAGNGAAQTTDLVHRILERTVLRPDEDLPAPSEAIRDVDREPTRRWTDREHFFNYVAWLTVRIMLTDYARAGALKRGGGSRHVSLASVPEVPSKEGVSSSVMSGSFANLADHQVVDLLECLERFRDVDPRAATVLTLRCISGLTIAETATAIGHSPKTVNRDYRFARAWLFEQLTGRSPIPGDLP